MKFMKNLNFIYTDQAFSLSVIGLSKIGKYRQLDLPATLEDYSGRLVCFLSFRFESTSAAGLLRSRIQYRLVQDDFDRLAGLVPGDYHVHLYSRSSRLHEDLLGSATLSVQQEPGFSQNILNVGVIGSCVTRDNFNSRVSAEWQSRYRLTGQFYQMSFVSLFSEPISIDESALLDIDEHSRICTIPDFTKSYLTELQNSPPDVLIIDFRTDVRFAVVKYGDSYFTDNLWKIARSEYYEQFKQCSRVSIKSDYKEYTRLFRKACLSFAEFRNKFLANTKIILNSTRAVEGYGEDGSFVKFSPSTGIDTNAYWDDLEEIFLEINPVETISVWDPTLESSAKHIWGAGPVHYESVYYKRFASSLRDILGDKKKIAVTQSCE